MLPTSITELSWEHDDNHLLVEYWISSIDDNEQKELKIKHETFFDWLERKGYLDWSYDTHRIEGGQYVTHSYSGKHEYFHYITHELEAEEVHEYMIEKNITKLPYEY